MTTPSVEYSRFTCPVCEKPFSTLADKKRHVRNKHDKKPKKER